MQMPSAITNVASNLRQRVAGVMENLPGSLDELSTKANELLDKTPDAVRQGAKDLLANQQVAEGFKTMFGAGDSVALSAAATGEAAAAAAQGAEAVANAAQSVEVAAQGAEVAATATKAAKGAKGAKAAAEAAQAAETAAAAAQTAESAAAAVQTAENAASAVSSAAEGAKGLLNGIKDKVSGFFSGARWDAFKAGIKQIIPGLGKAARSGAIFSAIFSGIGNLYMLFSGERSARRAIGGIVSDTVGGALGGVVSALASGATIAALGALGIVGWPVTLGAAAAGFLGFLGFEKLFKKSGLKDTLIHLFT